MGSSALMARGVNTLLTRARSRSCLGGSIMISDSYLCMVPEVSESSSMP